MKYVLNGAGSKVVVKGFFQRLSSPRSGPLNSNHDTLKLLLGDDPHGGDQALRNGSFLLSLPTATSA